MRKYSSKVVDGKDRSPSRSMLRAVGFTDNDFKLPQIGIASTWSMVTPCNMHINELADISANSINKNGKPVWTWKELKEMLERAASNGDEISVEDFYFIMTKKTFA